MRKVVYYRNPSDINFQEELQVIQKYFYATNSRLDIQKDDLVVMRYSALPFFEEQERDIEKAGAKVINSLRQHEYVADLENYYWDLEGITPKTWFRPSDVPFDEEGAFVLKGKTNSKKFLWNTHMFAEDRSKVMDVYCRLQDDGLIGNQDIYIRKFIPLFNYCNSIRDLPISKEFRFFVAYGKILSGGFYWSNFVDDIKEQYGSVPSADEVPRDFLEEVIEKVGKNINFYAVDIAETAEGKWIVVELNDGMMSGTSENNLDELYGNLARAIDENG